MQSWICTISLTEKLVFLLYASADNCVQTAVEHGNIYVEELNIKKCGYGLAKFH